MTRLLIWLDEFCHWLHLPAFAQDPLCDWLDRRLFAEFPDGAQ